MIQAVVVLLGQDEAMPFNTAFPVPLSPIPRTATLKSFTEPPCPQNQEGNTRQAPDIIMIPPEEGSVLTQ